MGDDKLEDDMHSMSSATRLLEAIFDRVGAWMVVALPLRWVTADAPSWEGKL